jgi:biotin transport system substrate-specific component
MAKPVTLVLGTGNRALYWAEQIAIVISASLFVAVCARVTLPLPFTPVPLTLQNFGVLLVGLTLGSRRGFAALALYLIEGASGMPVFNPAGPGGVAQMLGATGGFLLAYPVVAFVAGWVIERGRMEGQTVERGQASFARACAAGLLAEVVLFAGGLSWLAVLTHSFAQAARFGLYWFVFAEVIKVMLAAAAATGWQYPRKEQA